MELINELYSELDNESDYDWKCKCKCATKKIHKRKWAFISIYKKNLSNNKNKTNKNKTSKKKIKKNNEQEKQTEFYEDIYNNNIDNDIENLNYKSKILFPKVIYDKNLDKIIISESEIDTLIVNDKIKNNNIDNNKDNNIDINKDNNIDNNKDNDKDNNIINNKDIYESPKLLELKTLLFG